MLHELLDVGDTVLRIPFWLFIDLLLSFRVTGIYELLSQQPKVITSLCPDCAFQPDERHVPIIIFICCVFCVVAISFHTVALLVTYAVAFSARFAWISSLVYTLMLRVAYESWDRLNLDVLVHVHLVYTLLTGLSLLIILGVMTTNHSPITHLVIVSMSTLSILMISYVPVRFLSATGPLTRECHALPGSSSACVTPAWHMYAVALLHLRHCKANPLPFDVCTLVDSRYVFLNTNPMCPAFLSSRYWGFHFSSNARDIVYTFSSYLLPFLYVMLFVICFCLASVGKRLWASFRREVELYQISGLFAFINFHWNRLNVARTLAFLWCFKVFMVICLGPEKWPILPQQNQQQDQLTSQANISFLVEYNQPSDNQSTWSVLLTRAYVATLVHGSETWLVVFGASAFFGAVAIIVVRLLVMCLDPSGDETAQLFAATADVPVDLHEWNAIEDPALALDENDVIAVEMLTGTGWNCAVVFLFLAFQYDLPSLPLAQRICCSIYGVIVIAITCIHPIQALIKSFLLRLGVPGRDSSWMSHIRPLLFCVALIATSICILTYVPEGLAERVTEQLENTTDSQTSSNLPSILIPRFGSSIQSLKARQMRIVLCGCQLLLGLLVTLIEYVIYQISRRNPDWSGFRTSLFWTKLIHSVLDYMISLLSFLTVCWLSIYDSIGLCRLLIICCYFYFILYPSAVRAYTWVRWRLLARQRMSSLIGPTETELTARGATCPICYSDMTCDTAKVTRCGHLYHTECLVTWMRRQLFCPICHADLLSTKVIDRRRVAGHENA